VEESKMETVGALRLRTYGSSGPMIIVLHGGPAAVGSAAGLARGLSDSFQVLEPWQRGSGPEPLTVAHHVQDLHVLVQTLPPSRRPAIVGESWGAMLALAYTAAHPQSAAAVGLVGCGTFDLGARARLTEVLAQRRARRRPYDFAPISSPYEDDPPEPFDEAAYAQTWDDMVRLQHEGVYPQAFAAIRAPVLMIHGNDDPHPGAMIRDSLTPHLPHLEYRALTRCGHSPWIERFAREEFFAILKAWLGNALSD
jgi:pimeloyl-ACP methyl ester carboxylesterase